MSTHNKIAEERKTNDNHYEPIGDTSDHGPFNLDEAGHKKGPSLLLSLINNTKKERDDKLNQLISKFKGSPDSCKSIIGEAADKVKEDLVKFMLAYAIIQKDSGVYTMAKDHFAAPNNPSLQNLVTEKGVDDLYYD